MAHIVISYDDIERIYGATFSGRRITRVKTHPWMARCLMVEFPGDQEDEEKPILLTEQVNRILSISELVEITKEKHGL